MREIKPESRLDPEEPKELQFPTFSIGLKHLPEAEKWNVGDDYVVSLKLQMTTLSKGESLGEKSEGSASFNVLGIDVIDEEGKQAEPEETKEEKEAKSEGSFRER